MVMVNWLIAVLPLPPITGGAKSAIFTIISCMTFAILLFFTASLEEVYTPLAQAIKLPIPSEFITLDKAPALSFCSAALEEDVGKEAVSLRGASPKASDEAIPAILFTAAAAIKTNPTPPATELPKVR